MAGRMVSSPPSMCGFISILGPDGSDAIHDALAGLLAIQHRGQDAAGAVTFKDKFHAKKGLGLVREVFETKHFSRLRGHLAVAHVRYPTVGLGDDGDVQPFWLDYPVGTAMAHNGNVTNFHELKGTYFQQRNIHLASSCDLEVVLYVFADALMRRSADPITVDDVQVAVKEVFDRVKGAYSVCGITSEGMYAFRDPYGIKPCIFGKKVTPEGTWYAAASESVVLDVAGYEVIRDLKAGEMVWVGKDRVPHFRQVADKPHRPCIFEYVYFARPDSNIADRNVYKVRVDMGRQLAREHRIEADLVVPVPDSGNCAALGYSLESGIPYEMAFVRNHYVGRSFLQPSQFIRDFNVRVKLNLIADLVRGKRVVIVDDSIVRGTTSKARVTSLKEAGAKEVHVLVSCPPHMNPCVYGIDFPERSKLMAATNTLDEIRRFLNADSLGYLSLDGMVAATGQPKDSFCLACYDGNYPVPYDPATDKHIIERRRSRAGSLSAELDSSMRQPRLL